MNKVNALKIRQNLGQVLDLLDAEGPILIEKNRTPRAVLISLEDYKQKFEKDELIKRRLAARKRIDAFREAAGPWTGDKSIVETIREIRDEHSRHIAEKCGQ